MSKSVERTADTIIGTCMVIFCAILVFMTAIGVIRLLWWVVWELGLMFLAICVMALCVLVAGCTAAFTKENIVMDIINETKKEQKHIDKRV